MFQAEKSRIEQVQHLLQGNAGHFFLGTLLHLIVAIAQRQLDVDSHAAVRIGMGILVEQRLFSFDSAITIEQTDRDRRTRVSVAMATFFEKNAAVAKDFIKKCLTENGKWRMIKTSNKRLLNC